MARVNHKKVKQLLSEKRSKITDRQFFTSRILALHFEDMAMAQTRRYKYNRHPCQPLLETKELTDCLHEQPFCIYQCRAQNGDEKPVS